MTINLLLFTMALFTLQSCTEACTCLPSLPDNAQAEKYAKDRNINSFCTYTLIYSNCQVSNIKVNPRCKKITPLPIIHIRELKQSFAIQESLIGFKCAPNGLLFSDEFKNKYKNFDFYKNIMKKTVTGLAIYPFK
ncbi:unnamed protein product [Caenorhabditis bovis]|uniref:DUF19 domain-containing protein n=1 Tax=Caenorhabditis bovis TaxID=2654633 RepID=A0A8S1EUX8_9PELO|nr:unnamed protein product [Caenorhabditis bovis]